MMTLREDIYYFHYRNLALPFFQSRARKIVTLTLFSGKKNEDVYSSRRVTFAGGRAPSRPCAISRTTSRVAGVLRRVRPFVFGYVKSRTEGRLLARAPPRQKGARAHQKEHNEPRKRKEWRREREKRNTAHKVVEGRTNGSSTSVSGDFLGLSRLVASPLFTFPLLSSPLLVSSRLVSSRRLHVVSPERSRVVGRHEGLADFAE